MTFTSYTFLVFLATVMLVLATVPKRFSLLVLLVASYLFYGYREPLQCIVLVVVTATCFFATVRLTTDTSDSRRKKILAAAVVVNLGLLVGGKYLLAPAGGMLAPLGISFFTLQGIAFCVDTFRKTPLQELRLGRVALFFSFFPYIQSGPIHRAKELLPQFDRFRLLQSTDLYQGGKRVLWGFFKKLVVADKLALMIDPVFAEPMSYSGWSLLAITYLYAVQLYADFSGYTDIAIGLGRLFGLRLSENFRNPYLAESIQDFWKRWHVTLTSWFRDYIYIPLGGNRTGVMRWIGNILLVFLLSGFWHGVGPTFLAWGLAHGMFYLIGVTTAGLRSQMLYRFGIDASSRYWRPMKIMVTFHLVAAAWILFRAASLSDAGHIVQSITLSILGVLSSLADVLAALQSLFTLTPLEYIGITMAGMFIVAEFSGVIRRHFLDASEHRTGIGELAVFNFCVLALVFLGDIGVREFLYFNF